MLPIILIEEEPLSGISWRKRARHKDDLDGMGLAVRDDECTTDSHASSLLATLTSTY